MRNFQIFSLVSIKCGTVHQLCSLSGGGDKTVGIWENFY